MLCLSTGNNEPGDEWGSAAMGMLLYGGSTVLGHVRQVGDDLGGLFPLVWRCWSSWERHDYRLKTERERQIGAFITSASLDHIPLEEENASGMWQFRLLSMMGRCFPLLAVMCITRLIEYWKVKPWYSNSWYMHKVSPLSRPHSDFTFHKFLDIQMSDKCKH